MAFNPHFGYVSFAADHRAMAMTAWKPEDVVYREGEVYTGVDYQCTAARTTSATWETVSPCPLLRPARDRERPGYTGDRLGHTMALDAKSGETVRQLQTGGLNASPINYGLDGTQHIPILSGPGGHPSYDFKGRKGGMVCEFALESAVPGAEALRGRVIEPGADRGRAADLRSIAGERR